MSNFKVFVGNSNNQAQYVGQILDDTNIAKLNNAASFPTQTGNSGKFLTTNGSSVSWATVDALPSQTSQSGKFLTTNGTTASWATVDALPSQTSQSGKFLTTNGTTASWATVDALPTQSGNSGKFLTTNGSIASWTSVSQLPSQSGNSGKFLTTNGSTSSWTALPIDNTTVTKNISTNNLQASGTLNHNTASGATDSCFNWIGTLQEYTTQNIATTHPEWICYITDDINGGTSVYTKSECDAKFMPVNASITSIQVYATEAAAQAASQADSTKLCLYPVV